MDEVESQQRLIEAAVSSTFGAWRSQLRVQLEESHVLRRELEKKSEELRQLQQNIPRLKAVQQENEHLRAELKALRSQHASVTPPRRHAELEHERDGLLQENALKQATIDSLQVLLKREKTKSMNWWRHSKSSPSPSVSARRTSPHHYEEVGPVPDTASIADGIPILSNEAPLQRLAAPSDDAEAEAGSSDTSAGYRITEHASGRSEEYLTTKYNLPPPTASNGPEYSNAPGPISFPDLDTTRSHEDSPLQLPTTTSPRPQSSPTTPKLDGLSLPHERTIQSPKLDLSSDATAPPSQSHLKQESNRKQLPQELSSDPVEVVSARAVRSRGQTINIPEPSTAKVPSANTGSAEDPITVKAEPSQSSRVVADDVPGILPSINESLEDTVFSSPKKPRSPQQDLAPGPPQMAGDEMVVQDDNRLNVQPIASLPAGGEESGHPPGSARSRPLKEIKNEERVLPLNSSPSGPPSKKRKSNDGRGAAAIPIIAEDGEDHNRSSRSRSAQTCMQTSPARNHSAHRRLGDLLERPSPARAVLRKPSQRTINLMDGYLLDAVASATSATKTQLNTMRTSEDKSWEWYESAEVLLKSVGSQLPPRPEKTPISPKNNAIASKAQHDLQRPLSASKRRLPEGPEGEEPFRSRPIHRLDLCHFKVNPTANAGVDYAYTDVIRNRDQRKCLPGCTRPECCGNKFRAIAQTLPDFSAKAEQSLVSNLSNDAITKHSDDDLLVGFLGPGSDEKIRTLTSVARANLLLEAKTKMAADKYGKMHRYAHERPKSPPGFWTTEMPGTQEEMASRLDAHKRERQEVERRYREACQEGGRWIFADE